MCDVDYTQEENTDDDGNLSTLQNEGNQIKVLHCPPKRSEGRDLYFPGTDDERREQFWEKRVGWRLYPQACHVLFCVCVSLYVCVSV